MPITWLSNFEFFIIKFFVIVLVYEFLLFHWRMPFYVMSQMQRLKEAPQKDLYPVLDSLNQLGEVPWVINQPILDLQLKVFR